MNAIENLRKLRDSYPDIYSQTIKLVDEFIEILLTGADAESMPCPLDVDAEPIKIGDKGYSYLTGCELPKVVGFTEDRFGVKVELKGGYWIDPELFTHQKPILCVDGLPIRPGEMVWDIGNGQNSVVSEVDPEQPMVHTHLGTYSSSKDPEWFSHENPGHRTGKCAAAMKPGQCACVESGVKYKP